MQITNTILMVRPASFRANEQTAINNFFQRDLDLRPEEINERARQEFDVFVEKLRKGGVQVIVAEDLPESETPDALFPNNWVSFHDDGTVVLYPMFAENRRREKRTDILALLEDHGFRIAEVMDYSSAEADNKFLEGTGSLVLDRVNKKAYCALSDRADEDLVIEFCEDFEYDPVIFTAKQRYEGELLPIYHTNVMMAVGEDLAVICSESIIDKKERREVLRQLRNTGKKIIDISEKQMYRFAGNMLQVRGEGKERLWVMSTAAYESLTPEQRELFEHSSEIIHSPLKTIETCGGGSARCMMAEVFLPRS